MIGRKIYYELATGNVLVDTGERTGSVVPTSWDQDFKSYQTLKERVPDTVGVLQLSFGDYAEDFTACNGYRVNLETQMLEFSYPTEPETPPVYRKPLSEEVAELKSKDAEIILTLVMNDLM